MRALQEQDFDKMAARVVDRFMGGAKLADAATEEAMGGQLAPDQIERLVQTANTLAFLRLMEQQKAQAGAAGPDMTQEFDPIDPRQIMQQIVGQVDVPHMDAPAMPEGMDTSMDHAMPLPEEHAPPRDGDGDGKVDFDDDHDDDDNDGPFPKGEKQTAKEKADGKDKKKAPPKAPEKDEPKEAAFRDHRRRKLLGILEDQYKQAEWSFEDALADITRQLKIAYRAPELSLFEKDALALDNSELGIAVQNMVREARGWPALSFEDARAKHAALEDRHLVVETSVTQAFERLMKIATDAHKLRQGADYLRAQCD